jgi:hypothetical protein
MWIRTFVRAFRLAIPVDKALTTSTCLDKATVGDRGRKKPSEQVVLRIIVHSTGYGETTQA